MSDLERFQRKAQRFRQLLRDLLSRAQNEGKFSQLDSVSKKARRTIVEALGDTLNEYNEKTSKLLSAMKTSKKVWDQFGRMDETLQSIDEFFTKLSSTNSVILYANKKNYKDKNINLANTLKSDRLQLFQSVSDAAMPQSSNKGAARRGSVNVSHLNTSMEIKNTSVVDKNINKGKENESNTGAVGAAATTTNNNVVINDGTDGFPATSYYQDADASRMDNGADNLMYSAGYAFYYGIGCARNYNLAFAKFEQSADVGDVDAMMMMNICYRLGHGVEVDVENANTWLLLAANAGGLAAVTEMAQLLLLPKVDDTTEAFLQRYIVDHQQMKDAEKGGKKKKSGKDSGDVVADKMTVAFELLLEAAQHDYIDAQCLLGQFHDRVDMLPDAVKWYQIANEGGSTEATRCLGTLYYDGRGVKEDHQKAFNLFLDAARAGDVEAFYHCGLCYEKGLTAGGFASQMPPNLGLAIEFYEKGASVGNADCCYGYGYLLLRQAVDLLLQKSSNRLLSENDTNTGIMGLGRESALVYGLPVSDKDIYESQSRQGLHWLRIAAERGIADASYQIGRAYQQGIGAPRDIHTAFEQFQWAVNQGHLPASFEAANILYEGYGSNLPSHEELLQATEMYRLASDDKNGCKEGLPVAMNALGLLLEDGRAHPENLPQPAEAVKYLYAAALKKSSHALLNLCYLLAGGYVPDVWTAVDGSQVYSRDVVAWLMSSDVSLGTDAFSVEEDMSTLVEQFQELLVILKDMEFKAASDLPGFVPLMAGLSKPEASNDDEDGGVSSSAGPPFVDSRRRNIQHDVSNVLDKVTSTLDYHVDLQSAGYDQLSVNISKQQALEEEARIIARGESESKSGEVSYNGYEASLSSHKKASSPKQLKAPSGPLPANTSKMYAYNATADNNGISSDDITSNTSVSNSKNQVEQSILTKQPVATTSVVVDAFALSGVSNAEISMVANVEKDVEVNEIEESFEGIAVTSTANEAESMDKTTSDVRDVTAKIPEGVAGSANKKKSAGDAFRDKFAKSPKRPTTSDATKVKKGPKSTFLTGIMDSSAEADSLIDLEDTEIDDVDISVSVLSVEPKTKYTTQKGDDMKVTKSKPVSKPVKPTKSTSSNKAANKSMNKSLNTSMARKNYAIDSDDDDLMMNEDSMLKVASISAKNDTEEGVSQRDEVDMKKVNSDLSFVLELDDSVDKQDLVVPFTTTNRTDKESKPPKPSKVETFSTTSKTSLKKPVTHKVFESSENLEDLELDEFDFDEPATANNNNLNASIEGSTGGLGSSSATKKKSKLPPSGLTSLQSSFEF